MSSTVNKSKYPINYDNVIRSENIEETRNIIFETMANVFVPNNRAFLSSEIERVINKILNSNWGYNWKEEKAKELRKFVAPE